MLNDDTGQVKDGEERREGRGGRGGGVRGRGRRKVEYRRHTSSVSRKMFGDVLFAMYASHFRSEIRQTFDFRFEHATRLFLLWQRPRTISAGSSTRPDNILRDNFRRCSFKEEFTEIARLRGEHFTIAFKSTEFLNRIFRLLSLTSFFFSHSDS